MKFVSKSPNRWVKVALLVSVFGLTAGCGSLDYRLDLGTQIASGEGIGGGALEADGISPEDMGTAVQQTVQVLTAQAGGNNVNAVPTQTPTPKKKKKKKKKATATVPSAELTALSNTLTALVEPPPITDTPTPSPTKKKKKKRTPTETATPDYTSTPTLTPIGFVPSPTTAPCLEARFVAHITVPAGTLIQPLQVFYKTWRVQNVGSCAWTSDYSLVYDGGLQMGGRTPLPLGVTILPGQYVNITQQFQAPPQGGNFASFWALQDPEGRIFGSGVDYDVPFPVYIVVAGGYNVSTPVFPGPISTDPGFTPAP